MSAKHILVGTISGIVAGAVVGLMLAPQSGEETRKQIADSTRDLKKKLEKWTSKSMEDLDDLQEVFKSEVAGVSEDIREKVLKLINKVKRSAEAASEEVAEA